MGQIDVLKAMGIPDDIIPEFADPNFWLTCPAVQSRGDGFRQQS